VLSIGTNAHFRAQNRNRVVADAIRTKRLEPRWLRRFVRRKHIVINHSFNCSELTRHFANAQLKALFLFPRMYLEVRHATTSLRISSVESHRNCDLPIWGMGA
jgi:hypothetical protein